MLLCRRKQDYNEALNQFVEAKKINPSDSEILYYAGLIRLVIKKDATRDAMPFSYENVEVTFVPLSESIGSGSGYPASVSADR